MSYTINKLSAIKVRSVTRPGMYGDGAGLWLQVSKSGAKSWIFRYDFCGRRREMGLGSCHTVDLALAREKAKQCRLVLLEKRDPIDERDKARAEYVHQQAKRVTFDECASAYISAHRGSWKSAKHAAQWETTIAAYVSPIIGAMPVADVDTALVVKVLRPIWTTKTETATRLRGRIESILDWATTHKFRHDENPARWRGHLENLLANPNKIAPVKNHPALPWREIRAFITELRKREGVSARAIEFAILTACRSGEVRGARWSEIDMDAKLWTIPAERMKAGKEHRVPLSTGAVFILAAIEGRSGFVFPGRDKETLLSDMSLTSVLRRMGRTDITVHGFRSTFRDWCSEYDKNSFSREVCEHALAHGLPDKVEAAYRRGDLLEKRVVLMQAWADYCGSVE
ncbi:tyrosine-type recombinase/integrase [Massilia aerilata]|uniref:Tyrosine-type recombinase/integrase n=1 Tax=Massilia aerilata TaxID=453817 RepID=A0ABW0S1Y1_9BURK